MGVPVLPGGQSSSWWRVLLPKLVLLPLLSIVLGWRIAAAETQTLVVGVDDAYPPYMYSVDGQSAQGLYPLLIRDIAEQAGIALQLQAWPWKRVLMHADKGMLAVGGLYKNPQRQQRYHFSDSLFEERLLLYVAKGSSLPFVIFEDLRGRLIGVNRGWSYGELFDQARSERLFRVQEAGDNRANLRILLRGSVDAIVADERAMEALLSEPEFAGRVEALATPVAVNQAFLAFAKTPEQQALCLRFNAALQAMKSDGRYGRTVSYFFRSIH